MGRDLRIGVAGATGALGQEVITVLDATPWRPHHIVPLARASTKVPFVSYGEDQVAVDDLDAIDLGSLDALLVCLPRDVAGPVVDRAAGEGVPVVDLSGSQLDQFEVPMVVPWVNAEVFEAPRPRDVVSVPSAAGTLLATILGPIADAGWGAEAEAHVLMPASTWGRDAVDELSRQVVAMFNAGAPPRKIFPAGLAFDLLPTVGEPGVTGWSSEELRVVAELARITELRVGVSMVGVPLFSGVSAQVRWTQRDDVPVEEIGRVLAEAGVALVGAADPRKAPRPRRVEGTNAVGIARLRRSLDGQHVHVWGSMDNLRVSAVAAVGALAQLLGAAGVDSE